MSSNPKCLLWAAGAGYKNDIATQYKSCLSLQWCHFILHKKQNEWQEVTSHGTWGPKMSSSHMPPFQRWPIFPYRKIFASSLCMIILYFESWWVSLPVFLMEVSVIPFPQLLAGHWTTTSSYGPFSTIMNSGTTLTISNWGGNAWFIFCRCLFAKLLELSKYSKLR